MKAVLPVCVICVNQMACTHVATVTLYGMPQVENALPNPPNHEVHNLQSCFVCAAHVL